MDHSLLVMQVPFAKAGWLRTHRDIFHRKLERGVGFEPTAYALAPRRSTTELPQHELERVAGFEPALIGWKPIALPLGYARLNLGLTIPTTHVRSPKAGTPQVWGRPHGDDPRRYQPANRPPALADHPGTSRPMPPGDCRRPHNVP